MIVASFLTPCVVAPVVASVVRDVVVAVGPPLFNVLIIAYVVVGRR